eukprot:TRINITY_DN5911_c0_g1_i1.p1 TRINITY_DN5911_c0_g1~~TRINITY_DN5911_c0_g1_i1.p1  ORF type:complete len:554 (-),score=169.00 TRINITY_DN5911_c0_g1_i1:181-1842(-)
MSEAEASAASVSTQAQEQQPTTTSTESSSTGTQGETSTPPAAVPQAENGGVTISDSTSAPVSNNNTTTTSTTTSTLTVSSPPAKSSNADDDEEDDAEGQVIKSSTGPKPKDDRDHMSIVFIGHVDAGKSTIAGQTLLLTGQVDARAMEKFEKVAKDLKRDSWYIAFIMDTDDEERAKGKTVEVGRAYFSTAKRRFTVLDAPGHKSYVPNMIGGVAQADLGVLVISARKGEFETGFERGGQTREHAVLAKTLGVNTLIVLVNKMDEKSVGWDNKARWDEIQSKLNPFLRSTGFNIAKQVIYVPVSGLKGMNMLTRLEPGVCPFYNGPSFIETLETVPLPKRSATGALRIPILDKFREGGKLYIQGKIEAGTVKYGDRLMVYPNKEGGEITYLGTDTEEREECGPGENVKVSIQNTRPESITQGFMICNESHPCNVVSKFEVQLYVTELLPHKPLISAGYQCVLHIHTAREEMTVVKLVSLIDPKTGKPATGPKPQYVQKGGTVVAHVVTSQPVCVETYKDFPQLGRFTLRDEGITIGIGKILRLAKPGAGASSG